MRKILFRNAGRMLPLLVVMLLVACGGPEKPVVAENTDTAGSADTVKVESYFQIPLPGDLYATLKELGVKARPGLLNIPGNVSSYTTAKQKALNFGVYSSDLFYSSIFNQKADVLKYFNNLKMLGDELGISSVVTSNTLNRIEKNLNNGDSLNKITNDVFYEASANLERNGKGATLALVVAGGLVESLYLSTRLAGPYSEGSSVVQHIADQKYPVENLFSYFEKYSTDAQVAEVRQSMGPIKQIFDSISEENAPERKRDGSGQHVLGGSTRLKITAEQYKELSEAASNLRNEFTGNTAN